MGAQHRRHGFEAHRAVCTSGSHRILGLWADQFPDGVRFEKRSASEVDLLLEPASQACLVSWPARFIAETRKNLDHLPDGDVKGVLLHLVAAAGAPKRPNQLVIAQGFDQAFEVRHGQLQGLGNRLCTHRGAVRHSRHDDQNIQCMHSFFADHGVSLQVFQMFHVE